MNFEEIDKKKFDQYFKFRQPESSLIANESKWWISTNKHLLVFIGLDMIDKNWMGGILAPDENGDFRAIKTVADIETETEVENVILEMAEVLYESGKVIYFQNLSDNSELFFPKFEKSLNVLVHDQNNNDDEIAGILARLSLLYKKMGGSGITFEASGIMVEELMEV